MNPTLRPGWSCILASSILHECLKSVRSPQSVSLAYAQGAWWEWSCARSRGHSEVADVTSVYDFQRLTRNSRGRYSVPTHEMQSSTLWRSCVEMRGGAGGDMQGRVELPFYGSAPKTYGEQCRCASRGIMCNAKQIKGKSDQTARLVADAGVELPQMTEGTARAAAVSAFGPHRDPCNACFVVYVRQHSTKAPQPTSLTTTANTIRNVWPPETRRAGGEAHNIHHAPTSFATGSKQRPPWPLCHAHA